MFAGKIETFGINLNEFEMVKIMLRKNFARQKIAKIINFNFLFCYLNATGIPTVSTTRTATTSTNKTFTSTTSTSISTSTPAGMPTVIKTSIQFVMIIKKMWLIFIFQSNIFRICEEYLHDWF